LWKLNLKKNCFIEELSDTAVELNENPRSEKLLIPTPSSTTFTDTTCTKPQSTRPFRRNSEAAITKDVLLSVQNHFKWPVSQDDRYDVFGKGVNFDTWIRHKDY